MTEQELQTHFASRRRIADDIAKRKDEFKVCQSCLSISKKTAAVCPICKAYRWTEHPLILEVVLDRLPRRPFPQTAATAPRFLR